MFLLLAVILLLMLKYWIRVSYFQILMKRNFPPMAEFVNRVGLTFRSLLFHAARKKGRGIRRNFPTHHFSEVLGKLKTRNLKLVSRMKYSHVWYYRLKRPFFLGQHFDSVVKTYLHHFNSTKLDPSLEPVYLKYEMMTMQIWNLV